MSMLPLMMTSSASSIDLMSMPIAARIVGQGRSGCVGYKVYLPCPCGCVDVGGGVRGQVVVILIGLGSCQTCLGGWRGVLRVEGEHRGLLLTVHWDRRPAVPPEIF
jgi:hypothetical protein